ncbi:ATP-binding cassette domain-containing protein [Alkalihalobacillus pseudalcaliphilus]|uniref:ATP-binding cassette domain-containing protein n=1 Tax=Alkalihalobacillus pseudalcaliphilus TaxID=79884 RepID=UPI00064D8F4A|nr:ATP-binding cassette domain-containing protein [Alkalihalobacillus pseudalcaliphilus]KMK76732.1 aliphatic sulfonates transport ATP-binding subunit [Alkalihalobacillus pseudalcaliphilus]
MSDQPSSLQVNHVAKSFVKEEVLKNINLAIEPGEFVSIVGKSGCGKSTLLRLLAGLDEVTSGVIQLGEKRIEGIQEEVRIVFQNGRLLPWKTVLDNVGLGLKGDWKKRAIQALKSVQLEEKQNEWPALLSGGQQQRVSLARALMHQPSIMLLDEPLGALDALTRYEMQNLIERLWIEQGFTAVLVTHDIEEAVALSDRVILIEDGIVAFQQKVRLPRPRNRTNPTYTQLVDTLLRRVLEEGDSISIAEA